MRHFTELYDKYRSVVEENLMNYMNSLQSGDNPLIDAMSYSLLAGGKRIRPVLLLSTADILGVSEKSAMPFALAVEMIHTYSLIHDDLPAMDNDDYRRGKPSCHVKFGEGQAILAGDALLNEAYALLFSASVNADALRAAQYICDAAGVRGMIGGQSSDLKCEKSEIISESDLVYIIANKTGKLIKAPLVAASYLAGGAYTEILSAYGDALGALFQITDDILDVEGSADETGKTIGKDMQAEKLTCVKFYGLNGAKEYAAKVYEKALNSIENLPSNEFLIDLTAKIFKRTR